MMSPNFALLLEISLLDRLINVPQLVRSDVLSGTQPNLPA